MPWNGSDHGGFSLSEPWLPPYADADAIGVAAQLESHASFLTLYRRILHLRRALGRGRGIVTPPESTAGGLAYNLDVDGRRYRVLVRIDDGAYTTSLPVPGRVLLRASQPLAEISALDDAITLVGPDAAIVELAVSG